MLIPKIPSPGGLKTGPSELMKSLIYDAGSQGFLELMYTPVNGGVQPGKGKAQKPRNCSLV